MYELLRYYCVILSHSVLKIHDYQVQKYLRSTCSYNYCILTPLHNIARSVSFSARNYYRNLLAISSFPCVKNCEKTYLAHINTAKRHPTPKLHSIARIGRNFANNAKNYPEPRTVHCLALAIETA